MYINVRKRLGLSALMATLFVLGGCAATQTAIGKKDLVVQTKTSMSVFVDPVSKSKRTIYMDIKSGVMEFDRREFKKFVKEQFAANDSGYTLVDDPERAQFQMVAYVLNLEIASLTAAEAALNQGYLGGAVAGGAAVGALANSSNRWAGAAAGGLLGGAFEVIGSALVKDVTYMLVCDVQIREKAAKGVFVRKDTAVTAKISDSGTSKQSVSEVGKYKEYRTRIVTTANKANLKLPEAQPLMFAKTAYAMSGFF
ncbi:MAG: complement resistance protein TraT [Gammaproteobacteria bacterium]|nr:complement resistance protein TraT [Gammaproteobacteria bacterium]MBQ0839570.1 complement resistance protein TraT [Gammaproteobacteria bacterium]